MSDNASGQFKQSGYLCCPYRANAFDLYQFAQLVPLDVCQAAKFIQQHFGNLFCIVFFGSCMKNDSKQFFLSN